MGILYAIGNSPLAKAISFLSNYLLNPLVSGAALYIFNRGPDAARDCLRDLIQRTALTEPRIRCALQVLIGVGLTRVLNTKLSQLAANNFRLGPAPGWNWPEEVAVVTGGSSGIGLGIVERFLTKGIKVAVLDVQELPKTFEHPNVRFYRCDVTNPASVADAARAVRRDLGDASILINNAGITKPMAILDVPHEFLVKIFGVNTMSHWTLVKEFLPAMVKADKGHVVTVASVASFVALCGGADYSCTKASALAFHEALTSELKWLYKAPNVLTTIVHPNFVNTPLVADFKDELAMGGVNFLTTDRVADEIVGQVYKRKSAQVVIPGLSAGLSGLRGWTTWLQVFVRDAGSKRFARASLAAKAARDD